MLELRKVSKRMTITMALIKLKSLSLGGGIFSFLSVNVSIEDVSFTSVNTMPVMTLSEFLLEKAKVCGKNLFIKPEN